MWSAQETILIVRILDYKTELVHRNLLSLCIGHLKVEPTESVYKSKSIYVTKSIYE